MPHAGFSIIPPTIKTKADFWEYAYIQLKYLLDGQRMRVSNCANAASLIYGLLLSFEPHFGSGEKSVNWCGFYIDASLFPKPKLSQIEEDIEEFNGRCLLLGPFCGKPACQLINTMPDKARGVCADAFLRGEPVLVADVDAYLGHIACDGDTKSEVVCPLLYRGRSIGVLDLDCLARDGFDKDDKMGLERIAKLVVDSSDW